MKLIVAILLITLSAAHAQTAVEIQGDFTTTFNKFFELAEQFVDKLAAQLETRVNQYVATHQRLIDNFKNVSSIQNVTLSAENQAVLNGIVTRIEGVIANYRKVLDKNIFKQQLNKYMDLLQTNYLGKAQTLITELVGYIALFPAVGKCWADNKPALEKIVENGFIQARNAATSAVQGANSTLNINEILVNGAISGNDAFISICQIIPGTLNDCISTFLNVAQITLPAGSGLWELTTNLTVSTNLGLTEGQIASAISTAISSIEQPIQSIVTCVKAATIPNILG
jgi:hypothetical protein